MEKESKEGTNVLDHFYDSRVDFEIIAMTGLEGAGCSTLVGAMCEEKEVFLSRVRKPEELKITKCPDPDQRNNSTLYFEGKDNSLFLSQLVAKRKYTLCYNFFSKKYKPFTRIQYTKVLWLYVFLYWLRESNGTVTDSLLYNKMCELLKDKFRASKSPNPSDADYVKLFGDINEKDIEKILNNLNLVELSEALNNLKLDDKDFLKCRREAASRISDLFLTKDSSFDRFYDLVSNMMADRDYYYLVFFYHRLAGVIRTYGNPSISSDEVIKAHNYNHVFDVVKLVNVIIKGIRFKEDQECRIVIDSIRNTIEATYLKERYGAFYLVAVCADNPNGFLESKVKKYYEGKNEEAVNRAVETITEFASEEASRKEYEEGKLSHPNTALCVANADIHISNHGEGKKDEPYGTFFINMFEQWMKYASLMLHPGLITPSAEERCMSVAYVSSFNSSCVSRKVGAVITNKAHSIRTIGWNDAPYGQLPCGLRSLPEVVGEKGCEFKNICYSEFELDDREKRYDDCSFIDRVKKDYPKATEYEDACGVPFAYCFRTLDNKYSGVKNQVHTRSLHAEENALLQMAKYGGEPLKDGIIYVTASPCELCSKKLYQVGVRRIVYIEDYPGIAMGQIIHTGVQQPELKRFEGAFGDSFNKLFRPFLSLKDELEIGIEHKHGLRESSSLMRDIMKTIGKKYKYTYTDEEYEDIIKLVTERFGKK